MNVKMDLRQGSTNIDYRSNKKRSLKYLRGFRERKILVVSVLTWTSVELNVSRRHKL